MSLRYPRFLTIGLLVLIVVYRPGTVSAQTLSVGTSGIYDGNVSPAGVVTAIEDSGANFDGTATSATFGWSTSPCLAAVKIKFFRPVSVFGTLIQFDFLAERGPFGVTQAVQTTDPFLPPVTQTVTLAPPVSLHAGDLIAIANLTTCGGPTRATVFTPAGFPIDLTLPPALVVPGDVTSTIPRGSIPFTEAVFVFASGPSPVLPLLNSRFRVTLQATDPRNGAIAVGVPNRIGNAAGYFSLPDFTGDPSFPEVMIKMVDATGSPALGGDFWFFHAPLTDVQYTLTVTDQTTGAVQTYSNSSGSPGQLCGGVDTSAFPGP
jgi:hypothetical protein